MTRDQLRAMEHDAIDGQLIAAYASSNALNVANLRQGVNSLQQEPSGVEHANVIMRSLGSLIQPHFDLFQAYLIWKVCHLFISAPPGTKLLFILVEIQSRTASYASISLPCLVLFVERMQSFRVLATREHSKNIDKGIEFICKIALGVKLDHHFPVALRSACGYIAGLGLNASLVKFVQVITPIHLFENWPLVRTVDGNGLLFEHGRPWVQLQAFAPEYLNSLLR
jgi:hypothetical protein